MTREETLTKLQAAAPIESLEVSTAGDYVLLTLHGPLKFKDLDAVSEILKTERIDIGSDGDGCSCHGVTTFVTLTCYGVKIDD